MHSVESAEIALALEGSRVAAAGLAANKTAANIRIVIGRIISEQAKQMS
jgi:hypothetical protein